MIGLSANRLSASRLAGLREARQFRNGQWIEGGGSWGSPYSAAATRALKAAFSAAQWATIRDYGFFAHPEYIETLNWAVLMDIGIMYSLIPELGMQRIMAGTGGAYINSGYAPTSKCIMEAKMANNTANQWSSFGSRKAYVTESFVLQENPSEYILFDVETTRYTTSIKPTKDVPMVYRIDAKNRKGYINDNVTNISAFSGNSYPIFFFAIDNNGGIINENPSTYWYGKIWDGDNSKIVREMYPFKHNTQGNGMLDLVTGTFKPKQGSGSFTISETPS